MWKILPRGRFSKIGFAMVEAEKASELKKQIELTA